jgi:hypothetical protein
MPRKNYQWWSLADTICQLWKSYEEVGDVDALEWDIKELGKMISDDSYTPTFYDIYPPHQKIKTLEFFNKYGVDEIEDKEEKKNFLIFTRVLLKYLEQTDLVLHEKVKEIIKDCALRNKRQEQGYESVTKSMKGKLKQAVPKEHWAKTEKYFAQFLSAFNP